MVTGGAGGIGAALCRALLDEGMKVVVADVTAERVEGGVAELDGRGEVLGVVTDVSSAESVEGLADATWERFGACTCSSTTPASGGPSANVWETTPNDWRWVHGVNVMGVVHGILAFVPRMIASGEPGHVVNTSSGDGGIEPLPGASVTLEQGRRLHPHRVPGSAAPIRGHEPAGVDLLSLRRSAADGVVGVRSHPARRAGACEKSVPPSR